MTIKESTTPVYNGHHSKEARMVCSDCGGNDVCGCSTQKIRHRAHEAVDSVLPRGVTRGTASTQWKSTPRTRGTTKQKEDRNGTDLCS